MIGLWDEILAEIESDREAQFEEPCPRCGTILRDHYDARGFQLPCKMGKAEKVGER